MRPPLRGRRTVALAARGTPVIRTVSRPSTSTRNVARTGAGRRVQRTLVNLAFVRGPEPRQVQHLEAPTVGSRSS